MFKRAAFYNILEVENELAFQLSKEINLNRALELCLIAAIEISGMDSGGIYLFNSQNDNLELLAHRGLSREFIQATASFSKSSKTCQIVRKGKPIHNSYKYLIENTEKSLDPFREKEQLRAISSIPIHSHEKVIGCINVASHKKSDISFFMVQILENLAQQIGLTIERLRLEEVRKQQQRQMRELFNSLADFIFITNMKGEILAVNQTTNDRLEYPDNELVGKNFLKVHPPEFEQEAIRIFQDMLDGKGKECPLEIISKSGKRIPVETKISKGFWDGQEAIIGLSRDRTLRNQFEIIQKQNLEFLDFLVKLSTEFIKAPVEKIDDLINGILEKTGAFDLADRAYLFLFPDENTLSNTHEWCADGISPEIDKDRKSVV